VAKSLNGFVVDREDESVQILERAEWSSNSQPSELGSTGYVGK
jgi:hypothetical protein